MTVCVPTIPPVQVPAPAGVTLWLIDLNHAVPQNWPNLLDDTEHQRVQRLRFEADKRRYINSHVALRALLADQTGQAGNCLTLAAQSHGKPYLTDIRLDFNLSHSGEWALLGISHHGPIGVDIEAIDPIPEAAELAARNFTAAEQQQWAHTHAPQRLKTFLQGWTRKEACLKALGSGLSIEPHVFEAGLEETPRITHIDGPAGRCPMTVWSIPLDIPALAAVALVPEAHRHLSL